MSREDLHELAALDAFGLLDDYEAALFTRSFHHAPAAVQDEIKVAQAQYASDVSLLPDAEPPTSLKARVLRSVAGAIEQESVELAPLATIGRRRPERPDVVARIGARGGSPYWRAASFVLAAVALLSTYFALDTGARNDQLWDFVINRDIEEGVDAVIKDAIDPNAMAIVLDPRSTRVALRPVDAAGDNATAYVFAREVVDEESGQSFIQAVLKTEFLPAGGTYTLTAKLDGRSEFDRTFTTTGMIAGVPLELDAPIATAMASLTWEITDAQGQVLLTNRA
ncbi:MAG: hypothetical protein GY715_13440 [Planctomycetes bacterium]|nr:hypothetical protein [Planctomycetota bacterium]